MAQAERTTAHNSGHLQSWRDNPFHRGHTQARTHPFPTPRARVAVADQGTAEALDALRRGPHNIDIRCDWRDPALPPSSRLLSAFGNAARGSTPAALSARRVGDPRIRRSLDQR